MAAIDTVMLPFHHQYVHHEMDENIYELVVDAHTVEGGHEHSRCDQYPSGFADDVSSGVQYGTHLTVSGIMSTRSTLTHPNNSRGLRPTRSESAPKSGENRNMPPCLIPFSHPFMYVAAALASSLLYPRSLWRESSMNHHMV